MSTRSFWKGMISFGLLNIPVSLHSAAEGKEVHFSFLDPRNMSRIKFKRVNEKTGEEVPFGKIAKGYEYAKNEFVIVTDKDIKAANPAATQTIEVEDFVDAGDIDPLLFEKPYYIVPEKAGLKGYRLLRDVLEKEHKAAVGKMVMHTRQHLVSITPRGQYLILEQLRFAHEVLTVDEVSFFDDHEARGRYTPKEFAMAQRLVQEMTKRWNPERYKDTYYNDLMVRIKAKVKAGKGALIEEAPEAEAPEASNMVDLMPLLKKSLQARSKRPPRKKAA